MARGEGKGTVAGMGIPPVVARLGVPLAAVVGFAAQFLVSLRTEKPWATIVPGLLLYLVALALLLLGLRSGGAAARSGGAAGVPDAAAAVDPDRGLRGKTEWCFLAILLLGAMWLRVYRIDVVPWGLNNDEAINA